MSKVERVLRDCFSKIMAMVLCFRGESRCPDFHARFSSREVFRICRNSVPESSARVRKSRPIRVSAPYLLILFHPPPPCATGRLPLLGWRQVLTLAPLAHKCCNLAMLCNKQAGVPVDQRLSREQGDQPAS